MTRGETESTGPRGRGEAFALLCLGLFLLGIVYEVHFASYEGPRWVAWLMRGFFDLLVGAIATFSLARGIQKLIGPRKQAASLPDLLLDFCPACCETTSETDLFCPRCKLSLAGRREHWKSESSTPLELVLGFGLGGGLLFFGFFLAVGPIAEGEHRIGFIAAYLALGLLVGAVGAVIFFGLLGAARESFLSIERWTYTFDVQERNRSTAIKSSAVFSKRGLIDRRGSVKTTGVLEVHDVADTQLPSLTVSFVRVLGLLFADSLLTFRVDQSEEWSQGKSQGRWVKRVPSPGAPLVRTQTEQIVCIPLFNREPSRQFGPVVELLLGATAGTSELPLTALWDQVERVPHAELVLRQCLNHPDKLAPPDRTLVAQLETALGRHLARTPPSEAAS